MVILLASAFNINVIINIIVHYLFYVNGQIRVLTCFMIWYCRTLALHRPLPLFDRKLFSRL